MYKPRILLPALFAAAAACVLPGAIAQEPIQRNAQGYAQCPGAGNSRPSGGGMGTRFANMFWSHAGCGYRAEAFDMLAEAPKSRRPIPNKNDQSAIASCYYNAFPVGRDLNPPPDAGGNVIRMNRIDFTRAQFAALQAATLQSCYSAR
jgi:hypothetical protein